MFCENCGKNYASIKYTQVINGKKREILLCDECGKKLGIGNFNIPIDLSSFLSDFFTELESSEIFPDLLDTKKLKCNRCNQTFEEFINTGKLGCPECYETFEEKIDTLLKNIQGADRHIGRLGKNIGNSNTNNIIQNRNYNNKNSGKLNVIDQLKQKLKIAISDEKYEEAAILRDEIKKMEEERR